MKNRVNRQLAEDKSKEEKRNNGMKKETEIEVVPSSSASASEEGNEEEEEAKSSNNSNQNSNKAKEGEEEEEEENEDFKEKKNVVGSYCFPMQRIKRIIRSEGDDFRTTHEAVFLINKATEQFLELFCEDAFACSVQDRKKAVAYKHLSSVVCKEKRYDFLSDFVPEKLRAEEALADRGLAGPRPS